MIYNDLKIVNARVHNLTQIPKQQTDYLMLVKRPRS